MYVSAEMVPADVRERFRTVTYSKKDVSGGNNDTGYFVDAKTVNDISLQFKKQFAQPEGFNDLSIDIKNDVASETYLKDTLGIISELSNEYKFNIPLKEVIVQKMSDYGQVKDFRLGGKDYKILYLNGKNATYEDIARKLYANADADRIKYVNGTHEAAHLMITKDGRTNANWKQEDAFLTERKNIWDEYSGKLSKIKRQNWKSQKWYIGDYGSRVNSPIGIEDFMAECFSEYLHSSNPTKYAKEMGKLIDKYFKKD
jgi:hypothetical protein